MSISCVRPVVTLLGILAAVPVLAQGRQSSDWKRIETVDLVVAGNASEGELRRSATNLEQFRGVLQQVFPSEKQAPAVPTTLVLLKSDSAFARFRPRDERGKPRNVAGYFTAGSDVAYMVPSSRSPMPLRSIRIPTGIGCTRTPRSRARRMPWW